MFPNVTEHHHEATSYSSSFPIQHVSHPDLTPSLRLSSSYILSPFLLQTGLVQWEMHHKPKHNSTRLCRNSTVRCSLSFPGSELRNGPEPFFSWEWDESTACPAWKQQGWAQSSLCRSAEKTLFSITPGAGSPQKHDRPVMVYGLPKVPVTERGCKTPARALQTQQGCSWHSKVL